MYREGENGAPFKVIELKKGLHGTWFIKLKGNLEGTFYAFRVMVNGSWNNEVPDPYAKAVGINGKRAMVVNLKATDPPGWTTEKSPAFSKFNKPTEAVIYELHIRDASINANSGIRHKGKYSGLTETGTKTIDGLSTGLDHLKELGVTHIHLLPFFDYNSVDETTPGKPQYNWGYEPVNNDVHEGSNHSN